MCWPIQVYFGWEGRVQLGQSAGGVVYLTEMTKEQSKDVSRAFMEHTLDELCPSEDHWTYIIKDKHKLQWLVDLAKSRPFPWMVRITPMMANVLKYLRDHGGTEGSDPMIQDAKNFPILSMGESRRYKNIFEELVGRGLIEKDRDAELLGSEWFVISGKGRLELGIYEKSSRALTPVR